MTNQLRNEKSPYLLQHVDNPVDWYPWSDEAFAKAEAEDKPVFLSIGYSTCHWCHVMAHESFEDEQVAKLMNDTFVNIKVDREERPDIDNTYMTVCQLLTGRGGWPLTIVMTPDKQPFFAATYIPKQSRFNRPGMLDLIPSIDKAWKNERDKVLRSADKIVTGFSKTLTHKQGNVPDKNLVDRAFNDLKQTFDARRGGFGNEPKFPTPHSLTFLLDYYQNGRDPEALKMVTLTLEKMRLGGIYDQVGFGFHRYSTDRGWLLPHFEKMLYDQAGLMSAYTDAWTVEPDGLFKKTVFEIAEYISEQLTAPEGGFYSAEDADSEGEEGKFYVWPFDEISSLLSPEETVLFTDTFHLQPEGNFMDEATGQKTGMNIPHRTYRPDLTDDNSKESSTEKRIEAIRRKLKSERELRVRPLRDDKILTDWNGLMIAALARAGDIFEEPDFLRSAQDAWAFITSELINDGNLLHRYRDGEAAIPAMADDYTFLIHGLIELYQATLHTDYLKTAIDLNQDFLSGFLDEEHGGFFFTDEKSESLLGRKKEIYDGAIPSSNSFAAMNLLRLSRLTGDTSLEQKADDLFRSFSAFLQEAPSASTYAMRALLRATQQSSEIVVCGDENDTLTRQMLREIKLKFKSPYVLLLKTRDNQEQLAELAPYAANFPVEENPAVYICTDFSCKAPVYSLDELGKVIEET